MSRRVFGVVAAALAVITGGIAGGAVAFSVFALPSSANDSIAAPVPDAVASVERTRSVLEVQTVAATTPTVDAETAAATSTDETRPASPTAVAPAPTVAAAAAAPSCPSAISGTTAGAPGVTSAGGVAGTTTADLDAFAAAYNAQRVANCLAPVPLTNFRYDSCMETRLFWMAEDPSSDTSSAWGHIGSVRSDGLPSVGCDGNLAGGMNNTGATFARKWWDSMGHRLSLYVPDYVGSMSTICIYFAVTHGGVPDEPVAFARAAARWGDCTARVPGERLSVRSPGISP